MSVYTWTDSAAMWQIRNGTKDTARYDSAWNYLNARLSGMDAEKANILT